MSDALKSGPDTMFGLSLDDFATDLTVLRRAHNSGVCKALPSSRDKQTRVDLVGRGSCGEMTAIH